MSQNNGSLGNFLLGAAVGAGLALLLAPMDGGETRRQLRGAARKLRDRASDALETVKDTVREGADEAGAALDSGKEAMRRGLGDRG